MNAFEPGPDHRFAFGLRSIGHSHRGLLGEVPPAPIEPWEFVYRLGDLNAWGVGFYDDDLVPFGASPSEGHDILDKFSKALDSTGIVVSIARTNLSGQPVFDRGAFTSMDRDVRRYAIQKAMRAIDLGAELGAQLHGLSSGGEGAESVAAKAPLDALDRYREAVDFLCGYVHEQRYPTRFALLSMQHERSDDSFLPTVGHALAFIDTLEHPEMVGLDPVIVHGAAAGSGGCHGVAQAIDAGKLVHIELNTQPAGRDGQDPTFGAASVCDAFFLVKLLEQSGYDGPLHFDVDRSCFDDSDGVWDVAVGCVRTYRALVAKAKRFDDDPEIRDALAECGALELAEPSVGPFTVDAGRDLSTERFDPHTLAERRLSNHRLDQLVIDLVLGLR
jgi:xylose isomerase